MIYTNKKETKGTLCKALNKNWPSPMEKKFEKTPSLVMIDHYFKHCIVTY